MEEKENLYLFFSEYADFMEEMETIQKEKLESILSNDLGRMERSIKVQQAYAMRLDNIENRRIRLQAETGFGGMTLSEIISCAPEERKTELRLLFDRISRSLGNIKYFNDKAFEVADMNLRSAGEVTSDTAEGRRIDTKV
jgi:hypothetical protein